MKNSNSSSIKQCSDQLNNFQHAFGQVYPYVALVICVVSIGSNLSNIIILGQRKMSSPTNIILLAIATSDIIVCISQIPLIISQNNPGKLNYYFWTLTYLFTTNSALLAHTVSLWLGVVLAMFRLLFIRLYPSALARKYLGIQRARLSVILTYILWILLLVPYITTMRIITRDANNMTYFIPTRTTYYSIIEMYNFWNIAIFGKILPCALTIVFGCYLLSTLKFARDRHNKLRGAPMVMEKDDADDKSVLKFNNKNIISARFTKRDRDHRRTTRMLVSIILLVVPTELPIACLMLATRMKESIQCVYLKLGDLLDFLSLLKNFLTFVLYCSMSAEYRNEFKRIFSPCLMVRHTLEITRSVIPTESNKNTLRNTRTNTSLSNDLNHD